MDGGNSDTRGIQVVLLSFKGNIRIVSVDLRALTLAHCFG